MQKLCICVKLTKNNQASERDKVSFSAPGQIFFQFSINREFFIRLLYIWTQNDMARRDSNIILK